jgi:hypothetical protein
MVVAGVYVNSKKFSVTHHSREQTADSVTQAAGSRQQTAESRQERGDTRQQTEDGKHHSPQGAAGTHGKLYPRTAP